jgi:hypothetical protein
VQGHADLRGRVGGLIARGAPPEKIAEARAELAEANARAKVREVVAAWPPLSPEARAELAILLLSPAGGDRAAT